MKNLKNYQIKGLRNTSASGTSVEKGEIYDVPKDISDDDAKALIKIKKAEIYVDPKELAARKAAGEKVEKANQAKAEDLQKLLDAANNRLVEVETEIEAETKRADDAEAKVAELEKTLVDAKKDVKPEGGKAKK